jgi:hypothetical protein
MPVQSPLSDLLSDTASAIRGDRRKPGAGRHVDAVLSHAIVRSWSIGCPRLLPGCPTALALYPMSVRRLPDLSPASSPPRIATTQSPLAPARPTGLLASTACPGEGRGLPASRNRPSEPSVSNHRPSPMAALSPRPSPGQALTPQRHRLPLRAQGSGLHLWTAGSPDGTPNRVSHRTDGSFAFCCSPPRLAATRLQSAPGRSRHTWGRLAPP